MRTVVCVKQGRTRGDEVEFTDDGRDVDPDYVDLALNEWDSYATEEAIRLREAHGGEVVVVTCGSKESEAALRRCLAMGADRAVRVDGVDGVDGHDPLPGGHALAGGGGSRARGRAARRRRGRHAGGANDPDGHQPTALREPAGDQAGRAGGDRRAARNGRPRRAPRAARSAPSWWPGSPVTRSPSSPPSPLRGLRRSSPCPPVRTSSRAAPTS